MEIPQSVKATSHKDVKNPTDFQSLPGFSYSANWNLSIRYGFENLQNQILHFLVAIYSVDTIH